MSWPKGRIHTAESVAKAAATKAANPYVPTPEQRARQSEGMRRHHAARRARRLQAAGIPTPGEPPA